MKFGKAGYGERRIKGLKDQGSSSLRKGEEKREKDQGNINFELKEKKNKMIEIA